MGEYWVSVEAINYDSTIYDTDDLSTIRGASWAVLDLPEWIVAAVKASSCKEFQLNPIFTGASKGIYRVSGINDPEVFLKDIVTNPSKFTDEKFYLLTKIIPHLVVNIAAIPIEENEVFSKSVEAKLRNRASLLQYQTMDCDFPTLELSQDQDDQEKELNTPCFIDKVRPAYKLAYRSVKNSENGNLSAEKDVPVSASVFARKTFGSMGRRAEFYKTHAGISEQKGVTEKSYGYADNFEEIACEIDTSLPRDSIHPNLLNKMAVVYMDGNKFGNLRSEFIKKYIAENRHGQKLYKMALTTFSDMYMKPMRSNLLAAVHKLFEDEKCFQLNEPKKQYIPDIQKGLSINDKNAYIKREAPVLRFETLMWGGDENIFVIPAWSVEAFLKTLAEFFNDEANSQLVAFNEEAGTAKDLIGNISYSIGVVICRYKMPIRLAKKLAEELADNAKEKIANCELTKLSSCVDMMFLSSNELPMRSLSDERNALYRLPKMQVGYNAEFCIPLKDIPEVFNQYKRVKGEPGNKNVGIPRAKLVRILQDSKRGAGEYKKAIMDTISLFEKENKGYKDVNGNDFSTFLEHDCFKWAGSDKISILRHLLSVWDCVDGYAPALNEIVANAKTSEVPHV